jgi:prepilin-type N-terminal cleavage/methylation domain-containing protein
MPFLKQKGFTLLEMVVAMGLFTVGMLGLCLTTSCMINNNLAARNQADATQLARNKLEALGQAGYSEIVNGLETHLDAAGDSGAGIFQREVAVVEKASPLCKEVAVAVTWEAKGAHGVVLKTVFAP